MGDLTELAIWVFILAAVGFFSWIRKLVEKAAAENEKKPGGKRVDVGASVRAQIEKYMRAAENSPIGRGFGIPGPPVSAPPQPPPRPEPPPTPKAPPRPAVPRISAEIQPMPAYETLAEIEAKKVAARAATGGLPHLHSMLKEEVLQPRRHRPLARIRINRKSLKAGVLLAEILGPAMAERSDYRLF
jgi:hypothetical protein